MGSQLQYVCISLITSRVFSPWVNIRYGVETCSCCLLVFSPASVPPLYGVVLLRDVLLLYCHCIATVSRLYCYCADVVLLLCYGIVFILYWTNWGAVVVVTPVYGVWSTGNGLG